MIIKSVSFIESGKMAEGYFFYNSASDSDYGKINGIHNLTLEKALTAMKAKGLNPITNHKMNIAVYP